MENKIKGILKNHNITYYGDDDSEHYTINYKILKEVWKEAQKEQLLELVDISEWSNGEILE